MHRLIAPGLSALALVGATVGHAQDPAGVSETQSALPGQIVTITATVPAPTQQHCWKEYPTGSHFAVTRCEAVGKAIDAAQANRLRDTRSAILHDDYGMRAPGAD